MYDGDRIAIEYGGSANVLRRFVYARSGDDPILWYEGSTVGQSSRRYLLADHEGSIVAITDGSGNSIAVNQYDSYGIGNALNEGRFQYTGQAYIPEIGLYYYKARMYSPQLGRFMQTDPIGYEDDVDLYAYVGSDPVNSADPIGTECQGVQNTSCPPDMDTQQLPERVVTGTRETAGAAGVAVASSVGELPEVVVTGARILGVATVSAADAALIVLWPSATSSGDMPMPIMLAKPPSDAKDPKGAKAPEKPGEREGFKDGFRDPKGGERWVKMPNGKSGWLDAKGNVWVPTGQGGTAHGGPHWDVQLSGGGYVNVRPGGGS